MAEQTEPDDDAATRGRLTIREKAVQRVAYAAALEVDGVVRDSRGIGKLAIREFPRSDVMLSGDHVRATVEIAVLWGAPLSDTAAAVRRRVAYGLSDLSGLIVDGVDVHVRSVVAGDGGQRRRELQ